MDKALTDEIEKLERIVLDNFQNDGVELSVVRRYAVDIFKQAIHFYFRDYHVTPKRAFGFGFAIIKPKGESLSFIRRPLGPYIQLIIRPSVDESKLEQDFESYVNTGQTPNVESSKIEESLEKYTFSDTLHPKLRRFAVDTFYSALKFVKEAPYMRAINIQFVKPGKHIDLTPMQIVGDFIGLLEFYAQGNPKNKPLN